MATVKEERWQRDNEAFKAHCVKMNVECVVTVADNNSSRQANDVDNLLTQGVDVLVIAPQEATEAAAMVEKAKAQGVPVISYDRLINSDKIDLYISHQVPVIGRKIAEYALQHQPTGNYVMVYGSSTDNNAHIMKKEQLAVLEPAKAKATSRSSGNTCSGLEERSRAQLCREHLDEGERQHPGVRRLERRNGGWRYFGALEERTGWQGACDRTGCRARSAAKHRGR
jgi:ABC-type xylose transport system substrate-binding protein